MVHARNEKDSKDSVLYIFDKLNQPVYELNITKHFKKVIKNDFFGVPQFNETEDKLIFIAEKKPVVTTNFF